MKKPTPNPIPSFAATVIVAAVQLDLFTRMLFMSRRQKTRFLARTIFQQQASNRR
jgi:hypothetical protein